MAPIHSNNNNRDVINNIKQFISRFSYLENFEVGYRFTTQPCYVAEITTATENLITTIAYVIQS